MTTPLSNIKLSKSAQHPPPLERLAPERLPIVFILDSCLGSLRKWDGPSYHRLIGDCLSSGLSSESDLKNWLAEKLFPLVLPLRHFERARFRADKMLKSSQGVLALSNAHYGCSGPGITSCPRILFASGAAAEWLNALPDVENRILPEIELGHKSRKALVAVFNSRKSKELNCDEGWLVALRLSLEHFCLLDIGIASSIGTLTYDLVTAWALKKELPLLLVLPLAFEDIMKVGAMGYDLLRVDPSMRTLLLTCCSEAIDCEKAVRMVCRDRLLARLADFHWILELRSGGNLINILSCEQSIEPHLELILVPERKSSKNGGNRELLKTRPKWSKAFYLDQPIAKRVEASTSAPSDLKEEKGSSIDILWNDFLYHYTRGCPGPWPGQSYMEYLLSLLKADPLCAHTALDTLIRILREGRIRAGARLIRGSEPVISWSGVAPCKIGLLRRWNSALVRWTVEPCGIAVKRRVLRRTGAKPTIYGGDQVHLRLDPVERYRFQRHKAPDCMWKHEREWRLRGDFVLSGVSRENGFIFVSDALDAQRLRHEVGSHLPVRVVRAVSK